MFEMTFKVVLAVELMLVISALVDIRRAIVWTAVINNSKEGLPNDEDDQP